ncbi:MAG: hypothetical protein ACRCXB_26355 [Aeromonadaceae bacterium]
MKRQTKKGPCRSRAMPVSSKRFVVTDYDGCSYIEAGHNYKVLGACGSFTNLIGIEVRTGVATVVSPECGRGCAHLDDRKWSWATL